MIHDDKYSIAPPLNNNVYAEFYQLRKNASTMTASTIEWFRNHLKMLLDEMRFQTRHNTLSVLSIGSGEGDIDIEIIQAILPHLNPQWTHLKYDALEPNFTHRKRFIERLSENSFDDHISISVHNTSFGMSDGFESQESYDLVLLVQVLYYFNVPSQIIQRALAQTKPTGRLIIVHQSAIGIPELQREHMLSLKGDENERLTTKYIKKILDKCGYLYRSDEVEAYLDVTECLNQSEVGLKILSFCMECDLRKVHQQKLTRLLQSLKNQAKIQDEGSVLYEPIGIFTLNKNSPSSGVIKSAEDNDPVDDYRQLAQKFDWQKLFSSIKEPTIRLLEIACGTGRWIQGFLYYVAPQLSQSGQRKMVYDLLDNSERALLQAVEKIRSPLKLGTQYISPIQSIKLKNDFYDVIWSMHGFYAIPDDDLTSVIAKLLASLNETGSAFIAQATRRSFYVSFYEKYLEVFQEGEGERFVSAEDITAALETLGIEYQRHVISYHEQIQQDDFAAVAHYILEEATINSFSEEDSSETASAPRNTQLEDLFAHQEMGNYLKSLIKDSSYYFPEEIWLISFQKKSDF
nr:methyltransferase domain-containing protein [Candidatus Parabeggiatoa sp.]